MNIFIDDERSPMHVTWVELPVPYVQWTVVRNFDAFCALLRADVDIENVSFDHDLGLEHYGHGLNDDEIPYDSYKERTGMHCAHALIAWCMMHDKPLPNYVVHSMNPVGKRNIEALLENYKRFSSK